MLFLVANKVLPERLPLHHGRQMCPALRQNLLKISITFPMQFRFVRFEMFGQAGGKGTTEDTLRKQKESLLAELETVLPYSTG